MNVITIIVMKELFNLFTYVKIWINEIQKCEDARNDGNQGKFAEHHKAQLADHKAYS